MKYIFTLIALTYFADYSIGQNLNKSIDIGSAKSISISSDYPSVEVHTGKTNELVIVGHIYGNGMPLDDVVTVDWNSSSSSLTFTTDIDLAKSKTKNSNSDDLDGLSKEELKKIIKSRREGVTINGHNYYDGKDNWNLETHIVIYLPKSISKVEAELVYGGYEMDHPVKDVKIYNKYGSIDVEIDGPMEKCNLESTYAAVTLQSKNTAPADYRLQSNYGEIFTDVDIKVDRDASTHKAYKTIIVGSYNNGGDQSIEMRSDYANVYLRKL